jgi:septum formation protein
LVTGIILASASPRREQLLRQVGYKFLVLPSQAEENNSAALPPDQLVQVHARAKARDIALQVSPADVVIGADTLVVLGGKVFGKPGDAAQARRMLRELSGQTHSVWSGIAVECQGQCRSVAVETKVTLGLLSEEQIERYVGTKEPLDKAGAYAIQGIGAIFVEKIDGCYFNVVGLPLNALARLLSEVGVTLL